MGNPPTTSLTAIQAYRHLYRALLHAVQFSKPARYIVRDQIRNAFRNGQPQDLNQLRIARTLEFLAGAAREAGLEHKILKNLIHTAWSKQFILARCVVLINDHKQFVLTIHPQTCTSRQEICSHQRYERLCTYALSDDNSDAESADGIVYPNRMMVEQCWSHMQCLHSGSHEDNIQTQISVILTDGSDKKDKFRARIGASDSIMNALYSG